MARYPQSLQGIEPAGRGLRGALPAAQARRSKRYTDAENALVLMPGTNPGRGELRRPTATHSSYSDCGASQCLTIELKQTRAAHPAARPRCQPSSTSSSKTT